MIYPNVSVLPGLLLQVALAVYGVVDHQLMYLMCSDVDNKKNSHVNHSTSTPIKKTSTDVIYPNVSVLPGLLLEVVLAVHGVVDHQTT